MSHTCTMRFANHVKSTAEMGTQLQEWKFIDGKLLKQILCMYKKRCPSHTQRTSSTRMGNNKNRHPSLNIIQKNGRVKCQMNRFHCVLARLLVCLLWSICSMKVNAYDKRPHAEKCVSEWAARKSHTSAEWPPLRYG